MKNIFNKSSRALGNYLLYAGVTTFAFVAVIILPFLYGIFLTFTNWDGLSSSFNIIGATNYFDIFKDKAFWISCKTTLMYVFFVVIFTNIIAFLFAYILTSGLKLQNLFRAGFFVPNLLGGIVLGFVWQFIFSNVLVYVGKTMNWPLFSSSWLGNPTKAFFAIIIVSVWQLSGYIMIIYIAGFSNIPQSVLEASEIDGAIGFRKIKHIIIPLIMNSVTISVFLTLQRAFMVYDLNKSLTDGGPFNKTKMLSMYVYNKAFLSQEYGLGQAEAFILFVFVATISIIQVKIGKNKEVEA